MAGRALSTMEAAEFCGVHYTTIRRWVRDGELAAFETPGGHLRILQPELEAFIASRRLGLRRRLNTPWRVLAVDDEAVWLDGVVEFLSRDTRLDVRGARNGFVAGRTVAEFHPDVVILDLLMPGLDGFQVCRDIRSSKRSRHTRIIVLTGFPTEANLKHARECGADECLAKPIELDELHEHVLQALGIPHHAST